MRPKKNLKGPFRRRIPRHDPKQAAATAAAMALYLAKGGTVTHGDPVAPEYAEARDTLGRWWKPQPCTDNLRGKLI